MVARHDVFRLRWRALANQCTQKHPDARPVEPRSRRASLIPEAGEPMPTAPPSRCHCGARATSQGRCDRHQPTRPSGWNARPSANALQLTATQRRRIHDEQIRRQPWCNHCGSTERLEADHIIEISDGGSATNPDNLQTLCHDCHEEKSRFMQAARRLRRRRAVRTG